MKDGPERKFKILVVDDEEWNLEIFSSHLRREGFEVVCAHHGDEALGLMNTLEIDLVILDVMMPGKDGFQVCREILAGQSSRHVPVILATALNETSRKVEGLKAGATDFLSKPVDQAELIARVRAHLRVKELFEVTLRQKEELEKAYQKLQELSELQNRLTMTITHELRSPLTAIQLGLENFFLKDTEGLNPRQMKLIQRIKTNMARLTTLVNGILDLQQLEKSGPAIFHFAPCDIHGLIDEVLEIQRPAADMNQCYLRSEQDPLLKTAVVDRDRMIQILMNLVNNAIKYTQEGGVTVKTRLLAAEGRFDLEVRDTGPGIGTEDLAKLFQKFSRLEGAYRSDVPGSGLGLYITKELVARHGGQIRVSSELGKGSCFTVTFPLAQ
ncbi:MAG: hybrid sensor histidine kinase/response regulator [Candidatus Omnitrophota bacterium]|jgi:signal transduction histidine kinase